MSSILLYSTNTYLKFVVHREFRKNSHFVWCSEYFDAKARSAFEAGAGLPPSSDPAAIYRQLKRDVEQRDAHSAKITSQKAVLNRLAIEWERNGEITTEHKAEIAYMVRHADFADWRPLIYVIPRAAVETRLALVPIEKRASHDREYVVPDLQRNEFDIIEP